MNLLQGVENRFVDLVVMNTQMRDNLKKMSEEKGKF